MLNFGMPYGFADLLAKKYAILQQGADTQQLGTVAAAGLDNVRAKLLPGQTAADIAKTNAETANIGETTKFIAPLARSGIALQGAQGGLYKSQAAASDEETVGNKITNKETAFGILGRPGGAQAPRLGFGGFDLSKYGFGSGL